MTLALILGIVILVCIALSAILDATLKNEKLASIIVNIVAIIITICIIAEIVIFVRMV